MREVIEIDIELQLRGRLARQLVAEAERTGERPIDLLSRSVEKMILDGRLDAATPPRILDIADFVLAEAALRDPDTSAIRTTGEK